jgi:hypothetical protein
MIRSGSVEKTYHCGHGGGEGGPLTVTGHCNGSASTVVVASGTGALDADFGVRAVDGGVRKSAGAVVGEGGSGVARIGEDGPGGDVDGGVRGNGDVMATARAIRPKEEAILGGEREGVCPPPPQ